MARSHNNSVYFAKLSLFYYCFNIVNDMNKILSLIQRKVNFGLVLVVVLSFVIGTSSATYVLASATSSFTQVINPGTLSTDIVDGSYVTVASPAVAMSPVSVSFSCQTTTGSFGTASQQIYVKNLGAANNGFVLSIAAASGP